MSNQKPISQQTDYKQWLGHIKTSFRQRQLKAAVAVNTTLLEFYWQLGGEIVEKQQLSQWGEGFLIQLSQDLMAEFPKIKGFSKRNLELIRQWYLYWNQDIAITQQAVAQIVLIPWGHNQTIINKCKVPGEALFYVNATQQHGWSRNVLIHQIESQLWQRKGNAVSNFHHTLPPIQSDLAKQSLKDPYVFDFLSLTDDVQERELEQALVKHITEFLLELGAGFAYVVIELKATDFTPEHAGKLSFYLTAVDRQIKTGHDNPTIGLLLCKTKNKVIAEYALSDINKPIGVTEYQLTQALPENLKSSLPSVEEIEQELAKELGDD